MQSDISSSHGPVRQEYAQVTIASQSTRNVTWATQTPAMTSLSASVVNSLLANTRENLLLIDDKFHIVFISQPLATLWKIDPVHLTGQPFTELPGHRNLPDAFYLSLRKSMSGSPTQFSVWEKLTEQGKPSARRFMEYCLNPSQSVDEHCGVIVRIEDKTDIELAKQELVDTRQRLTDFTNATSDWQWEMDSDLRFTWVSQQIEQFYDMAREDFYGKPRSVCPTNAQEEKAWRDHCALLENRQPFRDFVYRVKTHSGDRWARVSGVPVFNEAGTFVGYRGTASDDTEVEKVKSQARQTESRFIRAIDEFPGSFSLYDENALLVVYNRRYAQIHAFLGDRLKPGLTYRDCLTAQVEAELFVQHNGQPITDTAAWIEQQSRRLRLPNDSVELCCADGRWMRLTTQRLPDGGCLETLVDITTLKTSELALKEERNLLRSLIDNIPDFIYAKDVDGRFIVKNRSVSQYMETVREHSHGLADDPGDNATDFDYYKKEQAEVFRVEDLQVIGQGESIIDREESTDSVVNDKPIWLSTSKVPLRDTEGKIIGLVGTRRNITEQKLAEIQLQESHERFRDFAETAAELFWETDASLRITYVSERYQELTGYAPDSVLGRPYQQIIFTRVVDPMEFERVSHALDNHLSFSNLEINVLQQHGGARHLEISGKPCFDKHNRFSGYRGTGRDITKARNLEDKLQYQASHDELTQLPNRREFLRRLELALKYSRTTHQNSVLGYLDLDQFKIVNDSVGHIAGDELLVQVTNLINSQLRKSDTIARLGGDEFGVLIQDATIDNAVATAERIIRQFETFRFHWNDQVFGIGVSIGLVEIGDQGIDASELMSRADVACFAAKDAGRGRVHVYSPQISDHSLQHKQLLMAAGIKDSIATNRFILYAQPIASIANDGSCADQSYSGKNGSDKNESDQSCSDQSNTTNTTDSYSDTLDRDAPDNSLQEHSAVSYSTTSHNPADSRRFTSKPLQIEHYEILLRLSGEDGAIINPGTFIPAAERYGLMGDIDRWVVTHTLQMMQQHSDANNSVSVTINLSGQSLSDTTLATFITEQLQVYSINPGRICFEITETAAIRNLALARTFIANMKQVGCTFALDDFGSGLSSFGYLKHFDVDYLKIDGSFVRDIATDPTDRIMVTSIDQIGKSLGIKTIAEFVESDQAIEVLNSIGIDLLQGYGIGKPVAFATVFNEE
jgi:diguanylate cyclase (GGDEF)-like protein/PAS domain S-box-containing protein